MAQVVRYCDEALAYQRDEKQAEIIRGCRERAAVNTVAFVAAGVAPGTKDCRSETRSSPEEVRPEKQASRITIVDAWGPRTSTSSRSAWDTARW